MDEQEKDFLDGMTDTAEVAEPEKVETESAEPERGVTPEPEKVEPAPEATPAPETKKEDTVPLAALRAEREKRQAFERELAELRKKQEQEQEKLPSFFEAPEQHLDRVVQQVQQQSQQRLLAALEEQAREAFPDYDEVFAEVEAHAAENPAVGQQILSKANPALAAYKLGKQLREMKAMQNPDEYRAKLEAEIRAKVEAEFKEREEAKRKTADSIPPDLASARSASGDSLPPPESVFEEIFKE